MDDVAETAMMFVNQAAKYSDRAVFDIPEAFEILCDTIYLLNGALISNRQRRAGTWPRPSMSPCRASQATKYPSIALRLLVEPSPSNGCRTSRCSQRMRAG